MKPAVPLAESSEYTDFVPSAWLSRPSIAFIFINKHVVRYVVEKRIIFKRPAIVLLGPDCEDVIYRVMMEKAQYYMDQLEEGVSIIRDRRVESAQLMYTIYQLTGKNFLVCIEDVHLIFDHRDFVCQGTPQQDAIFFNLTSATWPWSASTMPLSNESINNFLKIIPGEQIIEIMYLICPV